MQISSVSLSMNEYMPHGCALSQLLSVSDMSAGPISPPKRRPGSVLQSETDSGVACRGSSGIESNVHVKLNIVPNIINVSWLRLDQPWRLPAKGPSRHFRRPVDTQRQTFRTSLFPGPESQPKRRDCHAQPLRLGQSML